MNEDSRALDAIVAEVEAVFAKHGVLGAVVVSSEKAHAYGLHYPQGAPLTLRGTEDIHVASETWWGENRHQPFLAALLGLRTGAKTLSDSCSQIVRLIASSIKREVARTGKVQP